MRQVRDLKEQEEKIVQPASLRAGALQVVCLTEVGTTATEQWGQETGTELVSPAALLFRILYRTETRKSETTKRVYY